MQLAHSDPMKTSPLLYLPLILVVIPAYWLALLLTGRASRAYPVAQPQAMVHVAGQDITAEGLAARYAPTILDLEAHQPPNARLMWYEVVEQGDRLVMVYHPLWDDETQPNPVGNFLYRVYRQAAYGSERDTEYIEVTIDRASGVIVRLRFEMAPPGEYDRPATEHLSVLIERSDVGYDMTVSDEAGQVVQPKAALADTSFIQGQTVTLSVQTWNHIFTPGRVDADAKPLRMPLTFLDDATYRAMKMATRSYGDVFTPLDREPGVVALTVLFSVLGGGLILFILRKVLS